MTRSAGEFVTETTLQAVSGKPVRSNLWDAEAEAAMGHIELARWADLVLIAPATAEIMSRLAAGAAPDLLTTLCLATEAPVVMAPAMNHVMWSNPAVQENRQKLEGRGIRILGPAVGDQACGESGPGRMLEPDDIATTVIATTNVKTPEVGSLEGKTVMITAGPTHEAIDSVRYLSNRSSGKMGYALATAARDAGANVILVSGPVSLATPEGVTRIDIESAQELFAAVHANLDGVNIFVGAAAVADYHVAVARAGKIKKTDSDEMSLDLAKTPDVLASVARLSDRPFTVGFAAETENLREYALGKLDKKNLNMIIANLVGPSLGFESDDNAVDVYWQDGEMSFPLTEKGALARALVGLIASNYEQAMFAETQTELPVIAIRD